MNFLSPTDDDYRLREQCPVKNIFHETELGCYIAIDENGDRFHVYRKVGASRSRDGNFVPDICSFDADYLLEPFQRNEDGYRLSIKINNIEGFDESVLFDPHTPNFETSAFADYIRNILVGYHRLIRPLLKHPKTGVQYDLEIDEIFDVCHVDNRYIPMRPFNVSSDLLSFIVGQRAAFFALLKLYAEKIERRYDPSQIVNQPVREAKTCSVSTFCSGRNIVPEFKCEFPRAEVCSHLLMALNGCGKVELAFPMGRICEHILLAMVEEYGEQRVNALFEFKCHFVCADAKYDLPQVYSNVFGRTAMLHRLCLPGQFLTRDWYQWFLKKVVGIQLDVEL